MTTTAIAPADISLAVSFDGGSTPEVDYMFGIGLDKTSDAVYFQYLGDDESRAFVFDNGKPVTRFSNVRVTGLSIIKLDNEFNQNKLNLFLENQQGRTILLTSGLQTLWSQCVVTGLMGLLESFSLDSLINLDTWKGTSKLRPCFAGIRNNGIKVVSEEVKTQLNLAEKDQREKIMRDSVEIISRALEIVPVVVTDSSIAGTSTDSF